MVLGTCQPDPRPPRRHTGSRLPVRARLLGAWQADPEVRPIAQTAVHADLAAHRADESTGDRQPQASSPSRPRASRVNAVEALENAGLVLRSNAGAGVRNGDLNLVGQRTGGDPHAPTGGRVGEGVL